MLFHNMLLICCLSMCLTLVSCAELNALQTPPPLDVHNPVGVKDEVPLTNGIYQTPDNSLIEITDVTANGFTMNRAFTQYFPACELPAPLHFTRISPTLYSWDVDGCEISIIKLIDKDAFGFNVNRLNACFTQFDYQQPFRCFGQPMSEQAGEFIIGRIYYSAPNHDLDF